MFEFNLLNTDGRARAGILNTPHGNIKTPIFMPVGTQATVKSLTPAQLEELGVQILLSNTYHLYLRPQPELIASFGGLHEFMQWKRPILTDSGGFQVWSLSERRKITEKGVTFASPVDGAKVFLGPEESMQVQAELGSDIVMCFDECTPYPCDYNYAKRSMNMTHRWLDRCINHLEKTPLKYGYNQAFFPIVQGSTYKDLRIQSAEYIANAGAVGNAIGGLSVGEPTEEMYEMTDVVCGILPENKPRYLMGVGTPINILENIALGIDMFDCVMPTRNARNGMLFTAHGTINIKNKKWEDDFSDIDDSAITYVDIDYSKAYLHHLFTVNELLGKQIATIHNLGFYLWLVREARKHILAGDFSIWKEKMVKQMDKRL